MSWRLAAVVALLAGLAVPARAAGPAVVVSVAASLSDVLARVDGAWTAAGEAPLRMNAGGSNALARQIVEGAAVDVFISADDRQMDVVERAGRLVPGTRVPLLRNHLVVVAGAGAAVKPDSAAALASPAVRRVAMGQPESVPAGVYGKAWLESLGLWAAVQPKVVPLPTVRAALAAAREGRVDAAIVYDTDARSEPAVVTTLTVDGASAPAIVYPVAVVRGGHEADARRFVAFLRGPAARRLFDAAGFAAVPGA